MAPVDSTLGKQISTMILNLSVSPHIKVVVVCPRNLVFQFVEFFSLSLGVMASKLFIYCGRNKNFG